MTAKDVAEEIIASARSGRALSPEDWEAMERLDVAGYLDDMVSLLAQEGASGEQRFEEMLFNVCEIPQKVGRGMPLSVGLLLPFFRALVLATGGVTDHIDGLVGVQEAGVPSKEEFITLVAKVFIAWAQVREWIPSAEGGSDGV